MEIELLDAEGRPLAHGADDGQPNPRGDRPRSPTLVAVAAGLVAACLLLAGGGLFATAVRSRAADDLDRRVTRASVTAAATVARSGVLDRADPGVAVQVLQSPGTVVESSGVPADRMMVTRLPPPGATEVTTFDADDSAPRSSYRVAATTLPSQAGVAGRTVVAAALPLAPVERTVGRVRLAAAAFAAAVGTGVMVATRRRLRRARPARPA